MRQEIDKIEIKEPPIEELTKKRSCVRRTCLTGCGCFTLVFILSLILIRFTFGPRTKEIKDLPQTFVKQIPIYDNDSIERITFTSGRERGKATEFAAYVPKLVISPFIIYFDKEFRYIPKTHDTMTNWDKFIAFLTEPIADHRDVYTIEWTELTASQKFIIEYYTSELTKQGFIIETSSTGGHVIQFTFQKNDTNGNLYTYDDPSTTYTDFVSLTTNIPTE